jgi:5-methylcytosine-specific restriction endonuclease McrA|tara:strand:+ start:39 stop:374 length:336 start_codon:yes stop_codon:yes gene_type:complete
MALMFPKGPTRKQDKAKKKRREAMWIKSVREHVLLRDKACRVCGAYDSHLHMHEIVYRSQTRGRDIEERINTENCVMLCQRHHQQIHEKILTITITNPTEGANGKLEFTKR